MDSTTAGRYCVCILWLGWDLMFCACDMESQCGSTIWKVKKYCYKQAPSRYDLRCLIVTLSHSKQNYKLWRKSWPVISHYQQQKLNFNSDGLNPYFSTDFDAFYFSHFVTRWRYFRSSIYCQIRRVARLAFVCLWTPSPEIKQMGRYTLQKQRHSSVLLRLRVYRRGPVQGHCW